jgi:hypothetical protein
MLLAPPNPAKGWGNRRGGSVAASSVTARNGGLLSLTVTVTPLECSLAGLSPQMDASTSTIPPVPSQTESTNAGASTGNFRGPQSPATVGIARPGKPAKSGKTFCAHRKGLRRQKTGW